MLRRIGISFLASIGGYLIGAFGGGWLVSVFSSNQDSSVEAAMSGAFFFGPTVAFLAFIVAFVITGRPPAAQQNPDSR